MDKEGVVEVLWRDMWGTAEKVLVVVEKLWESLWDSLWETCGKVLHMTVNCEFCTKIVGKVEVFHDCVEKFCYEFCTKSNRGKMTVLHSFHSPYYYYYYLFNKGE